MTTDPRTTARLTAIRSVFSAMFDAVDVAGDFDEGRWEDLIAAFNATGRLVFGWPHLESREEDIFGALDDIAVQLEGAKGAIEQTATEARIVMHELHKALDPLLPEEEEPKDEGHAQPELELVRTERDTVEEPSPSLDDPSKSSEAANETESVKSTGMQHEPHKHSGQIEPVRPSPEDDALFAVIRADPSITVADAERAVGLQPSRATQRIKLLDGYGTLPADIKEWREARSKTRGVAKGTKVTHKPAANHPLENTDG